MLNILENILLVTNITEFKSLSELLKVIFFIWSDWSWLIRMQCNLHFYWGEVWSNIWSQLEHHLRRGLQHQSYFSGSMFHNIIEKKIIVILSEEMLYIHRGSLAILIWRNKMLLQKDIQDRKYPRRNQNYKMI